MGLNKYKLGQLLELCDERNDNNAFSLNDVKGISIKKEFIETKADMAGVSLTPYLLVRPDSFAYVPVTSRNGEKITLAHNASENTFIVSSSYVVFKICRADLLLSDYLFIYFNRPEFDRYSRFCSWGSARETFSWEDLCDIDIILPDIKTQQRFVDVYRSIQNNLITYQDRVDDLKLVCDAYVEDLRRRMKSERIGGYIQESIIKNAGNRIKEVRSVSVTKEFKLTNAKVNKNELSGYLRVNPKEIAFVQTTGNEKVLAFAYNDLGFPVVVSSVDKVFKSKDENVLDLQYLSLFLSRKEFDRYARYHSWGSAREVFTMEDMNNVSIPIPDISIQHEIVNIHKCYIERQRIAAKLREQLTNLCPILIKGSIQSDN